MMAIWLAGIIGFAYALGACLMMALWLAIPPRKLLDDLISGLLWPGTLLWMLIVAFINETVRAISDQDGMFAGYPKDRKWVEQQSKKKSPEMGP